MISAALSTVSVEPKNILLLTEFFPPRFGGVERSCYLLAKHFGRSLAVVAPPAPGAEHFDGQQPFAVIRRSLFSGRYRPRWWWLYSWLRRQHRAGAELAIFGHYSAAVTAGWLAKAAGLPYAVLIHGNDMLTEERRPLQGRLTGRIVRGATWIGVNSRFTAERIHRHGVAWSNIVRTHPAVDDGLLNRPAHPAADGKIHLITVCRLVARKNVARVIDACAALIGRYPELVYDVVGDGPEMAALRARAQRLGLGAAVIFHGPVSDEKKWQLMLESNIAIMAPEVLAGGSDVEGLGLFFLEAAAMGLPLVASRTGGIPDVVQAEENGLFVDPGSVQGITVALERLLRDPHLRQRLGQAGPSLIKREFTSSVRLGRAAALVERQRQIHPPLVSVIIPAYQAARTIVRTITSVRAQTWPNIEIIVVDDGSTDDLSAALQADRKNIRLLRQANSGAPAARNAGAKLAGGEFLLFLDADTVLEPSAVTDTVVALQTHPEASYAYSNFRFGPKNFKLFEFSPAALRRQNYIHTTSLIRRRDYPGFDPNLKRFQDWDLWLTMLEQGKVGLWIPKRLFIVSQRHGGMSRWLPRVVYRLPLIGQGWGSRNIADYRQAETAIRQKHHLDRVRSPDRDETA